MENIKIDIAATAQFVAPAEVAAYDKQMQKHNLALHSKTGKGADFTGWVELPSQISKEQLDQIKSLADDLKTYNDFVVVVGIGGSYLGAKCVIEALSSNFAAFEPAKDYPHVVFAGQNISEDYMGELLSLLHYKDFSVIVISKSGTTTEPAIAFRLLKKELETKYGKEGAGKRIVAITSSDRGALRTLADNQGYKTFNIPDDVGGRYSVLTPVGLLPIACAGYDIHDLVQGAKDMQVLTAPEVPFENNPAAVYAATRNALYKMGFSVEILVNYNPKLHFLAEWWKQLYGESEGKEGKGIFPASVDFSADLHSMGQYIQEGTRNLFETVISIEEVNHTVLIPAEETDLDKLNFLAGRRVDEVNKKAELGTVLAHVDGGVPNIRISVPALSAYYLGQLFYFFEKACGLSGYQLGVNPFDQPGVEAYKNNMFALLGKPGFENATNELLKRLNM